MPERVAIYGGSFNPPHVLHQAVARDLARSEFFDRVIVVPCGGRPEKWHDVDAVHRAAMADMAFGDIPGVEVDLFDIESDRFSPAVELQRRYGETGDELWFVVGEDLVCPRGGGRGPAVRDDWIEGRRIWEEFNWLVVQRSGYYMSIGCKPKNLRYHHTDAGPLSGTELRERAFRHLPLGDDVAPRIAAYVERHNLYRGVAGRSRSSLSLAEMHPFVVSDPYSDAARAIEERLAGISVGPEQANVILAVGGDGTMLRAVRRHWRLRLPFVGFNLGHAGFLMNARFPKLDNDPAAALSQVFAEDLTCHHLPMLHVSYRKGDTWLDGGYAFNDVWIERSESRAIVMDVSIESGRVTWGAADVMGDGLLVANAAGSTGYAKSMGAAPLSVESPNWLLIGNNIARPDHGIPQTPLGRDAKVSVAVKQADWRTAKLCADTGTVCDGVEEFVVRLSRVAAAEIAFRPDTDLTAKLLDQRFTRTRTIVRVPR